MTKKDGRRDFMKGKKLKKVFVAALSVVFALVVGIGVKAYASQITTITGLSGSDATVTNSQGQKVDPSKIVGDGYTGYNISYNWLIPDGTDVSNGDTATVTLPAGMKTNSATTGNVYDSKGQVVGTIKFDRGVTTGTITFNNPLHGLYGKKGTLTVTAVKESNSSGSNTTPTWEINKTGWIDKDSEQNGVPTKIYWDVVVNPSGDSLKDVKVTDTIGSGQSYIDGSATFHTVSYSSTGESQRTGDFSGAAANASGNSVTFDLGDIDQPVEIEYETQITSINKDAGNIWDNKAAVTANTSFGPNTKTTDTATVNWGTGGTATGYKGKIFVAKVDSADQTKVLPGATFELKDSNGKVVQSNIVTDSQGKATIQDLPDGQYQLIETKAPKGYQLSSTPITVTVSQSSNHEASATVSDKKIQVSSSSSSKSSSSSVKSSSSSSKESSISSIKSSSSMKSTSAKSNRNGSRSLKSISSSSMTSSSSEQTSVSSKSSAESSSKPTATTETSVKVSSTTSTTSYVDTETSSSVPVTGSSKKNTMVESTISSEVRNGSSSFSIVNKPTLVSSSVNVPVTSWTNTTVSKKTPTTVRTTVVTYSQSKIANKPSVEVNNHHQNVQVNNQNNNHQVVTAPTANNGGNGQKPNQGQTPSSKKQGSGEGLPQTGDVSSAMVVAAGAILVIAGSAVIMRKH